MYCQSVQCSVLLIQNKRTCIINLALTSDIRFVHGNGHVTDQPRHVCMSLQGRPSACLPGCQAAWYPATSSALTSGKPINVQLPCAMSLTSPTSASSSSHHLHGADSIGPTLIVPLSLWSLHPRSSASASGWSIAGSCGWRRAQRNARNGSRMRLFSQLRMSSPTSSRSITAIELSARRITLTSSR